MKRYFLLIVLLPGCGNAHTSPTETPSNSTGTEQIGAQSGSEIFINVCSGCHGEAAEHLVNLNWTAEKMTKQIREGEGEMPPIGESRLNNEELAQLLDHLRSIKAVAE